MEFWENQGVDLQIFESGFDGDIAVDFGAATEFLVGADAVEFFDQGMAVHVFQGLNFDQTGAAQTHTPAVQLGRHAFVQHDVIEHRAFAQVGSVADVEVLHLSGV